MIVENYIGYIHISKILIKIMIIIKFKILIKYQNNGK
jgi:hypothetical protein